MTTNENPAAVRVCAISDVECSRGCGTGECKREREAHYPDSQPAAAPIDRAEMVKSWGEISSQMFAKMTPWQFYEAGWVAACATVPAPSPADERAAFEAWWRRDVPNGYHDLACVRNGDGTYAVAKCQAAWEGWQARAASANDTGAEGAAIPAGYALVPIEPTEEMIAVGVGKGDADFYGDPLVRAEVRSDYQAMIAAAPPLVRYQILTEEGGWLDVTQSYYERFKSDTTLTRAINAAPQPAQADARVGLTLCESDRSDLRTAVDAAEDLNMLAAGQAERLRALLQGANQ